MMSQQPNLSGSGPVETATMLERLAEAERPPLGLGMTSLVLATVGLMLAFIPILGVPISSFALLFSILGFAAAIFLARETLRWSVAGLCLSALALGVNVAMFYAPAGYLPSRDVPRSWQPVSSRPYVAPPAP
jgi:phosphate/sulfate permease